MAGPLLNLVAVPLMAVAQIGGLVVAAFDAWPMSPDRQDGWRSSLRLRHR